MMDNLSAREQRLIALGILVALLAAVWLGLAAPIMAGFAARRDARQTAIETLSRNARLISSLAQIRQDALRARTSLPRFAVVAATPAAAAELVRQRLVTVFAQGGVTLEAIRPEEADAAALRYEVDARGDLPKIIAVVQRLESEAPIAQLPGLSIASSASGQTPSDLRLRLDVSYAFAPAL